MSFLPPDDLEYLETKDLVFEENIDGNQKGIILRDWALPDGIYDTDRSYGDFWCMEAG